MARRPYDTLDDAILANVRSALAAGVASVDMIADAYKIVDGYDHDPADACILEAASEAGVMQEMFLDRPPMTDPEVLAATRAALAAGHAPFELIEQSFRIIRRRPYDTANDDLLLAAHQAELLHQSHIDPPTDEPLNSLRFPWTGAWNAKNKEEMYSTDHIERLLQMIDRRGGCTTVYGNGRYGDLRKKALRRGWIANSGQTNGLGDTRGRAQWVYDLTDKGREALNAFEAKLAAAASVAA